MCGLTTTKGLNESRGHRYGLTAAALAALILLSLTPVQAQDKTIRILYKANVNYTAQAQSQDTSTNPYGGPTVIRAGTIGLVPGQMVLVTVPNSCLLDGSVRFVKHSIKIYERESHAVPELSHAVTERESGLVYSGESGGLNEAFHIFTFRYADLPVQGEPLTGRAQLWIVVESFLPSETQERSEDRSADGLLPTFELIDEGPGKTVLIGLLLPAIQK